MKKSIMKGFRCGTATVAMGWIAVCPADFAVGQEKDKEAKSEKKARIRIVDRDGQELSHKVVVGQRLDKEVLNGAGGVSVSNVDGGVITIRDADGKEHSINAASVIVSHSLKTTVENGEERTEVVKKAIVVDSDGKTYVIDLAPGGELGTAEGPVVMARASVGKFMIGIVAQPASQALSEQLNLEAETGLVVEQVTAGSPAAKAGLKENDVLLFANQKALKTVEDLVSAVQEAGEANEIVSLTLVRDDKEISIEVTPQARDMAVLGGHPGALGVFRMLDPKVQAEFDEMGDFNFGWAQAGPGFVFNPQDFDPEALTAQIEKMREQHRLHLGRMKEAFDLRTEALQLRDEAAGNAISRDQMQELLNEIKRLREEIESLKKEKK